MCYYGCTFDKVATWLWGGRPGVRIPEEGWIFLLYKMTRPALGPTLPPVKWVPTFFLGDKKAGLWCWPPNFTKCQGSDQRSCTSSWLGQWKWPLPLPSLSPLKPLYGLHCIFRQFHCQCIERSMNVRQNSNNRKYTIWLLHIHGTEVQSGFS